MSESAWLGARQFADYRRALINLSRLGRGSGPIVAGPFLSGVGVEALYWVPLLRWFLKAHDVEPGRLTVLARGGTQPWYDGVAGRFVDVLDHVTPGELDAEQLDATPLDGKTLREAGFDRDSNVLHPSVMSALFEPFRADRQPIRRVLRHTDFAPLGQPGDTRNTGDAVSMLPKEYVAVDLRFATSFPRTAANRAVLAELVRRLAGQHELVLLPSPDGAQEELDLTPAERKRLHDFRGLVDRHDILEHQSAIVSSAQALYAPYGGFARVGPFLGTSTLAFYSDEAFNPADVDVMERAVSALRPQTGAGFVLVAVDTLPLVYVTNGHFLEEAVG